MRYEPGGGARPPFRRAGEVEEKTSADLLQSFADYKKTRGVEVVNADYGSGVAPFAFPHTTSYFASSLKT
jgi:hypothetical protein